LISLIHQISWLLQPFIPETSERIFKMIGDTGSKEIINNHRFIIKMREPLFPRIS